MEKFEEGREKVIQQSREIIQTSKKVIFALIREDKKTASSGIKKIRNDVRKLPTKFYDAGIQRVAKQEYVEAETLYWFITKNKIPTKEEIKVDTESYLLGLCDLTGELVRLSVNFSINGKYNEVIKIKNLVSEIYANFLGLNLRNGEIRKKSDSIKWNLNKIEDLVLSIKTNQR